jgi:hypothetical protein
MGRFAAPFFGRPAFFTTGSSIGTATRSIETERLRATSGMTQREPSATPG